MTEPSVSRGALRFSVAAVVAGWSICSAPARCAPPGPLQVTFTVALNLAGLHPAAQTGALDCGAIAQTTNWIASHRGLLTDIDSVNRWVLSPAHYLGNEYSTSFPIANRAYVGTRTFTTILAAAATTDPATHAAWQPGPSVLIACWLTINGRPAIRDQSPIPLVAAAGNFDRINELPLIAAVGTATTASTVTANGQLTARGVYFVAGPVFVNATINTGVSAALPSSTSTKLPAPITLSGALVAASSKRLPLAFTLTGALTAAGGTRLPAPLVLSAPLAAAGGERLPAPIVLSAALSVVGGTRIPAPITLSAALTTGGAAQPSLKPRTQSSTPIPK